MAAENNSYREALATTACALCHDPKFVEECERRFLNELEYNSRMAEADRKGLERGMARGLEQGMEKGMEKGMQQGLEKGMEKGMTRGEKRYLIQMVCKKLAKNQAPEEIATMLEEDPKTIWQIYEIADAFAPGYDVEKVWEAYLKKYES